MGSGARLASMALLATLVAACSTPVLPPTAAPPAWSVISFLAPGATPDPCTVAVTRLAAFSERLASDLAALRPLIVAQTFDAGTTASADRAVAATLTAYEGLETQLQRCAASAEFFAARVQALRTRAEATLDAVLAASLYAPQIHRDGAVTCSGCR